MSHELNLLKEVLLSVDQMNHQLVSSRHSGISVAHSVVAVNRMSTLLTLPRISRRIEDLLDSTFICKYCEMVSPDLMKQEVYNILNTKSPQQARDQSNQLTRGGQSGFWSAFHSCFSSSLCSFSCFSNLLNPSTKPVLHCAVVDGCIVHHVCPFSKAAFDAKFRLEFLCSMHRISAKFSV
ncbi:hypothetical protein GEMRC1_001746 [Eukaryota sp. GEM-RC1]